LSCPDQAPDPHQNSADPHSTALGSTAFFFIFALLNSLLFCQKNKKHDGEGKGNKD
jgi:hypothetical protein